jgi:hypothetical protein
MKFWKSIRIACGGVALALLAAGTGHAFVNHENQVTFNRSVALPGVVLPAGSYTFERGGTKLDLDLVVVRNRARTKVFYTGFTNAVTRPQGMSKNTPITFGETSANEPPPIAAWYEVGDSLGHEFRYR